MAEVEARDSSSASRRGGEAMTDAQTTAAGPDLRALIVSKIMGLLRPVIPLERPSIDELEKILNSEDPGAVRILPDGNIVEMTTATTTVGAVADQILDALSKVGALTPKTALTFEDGIEMAAKLCDERRARVHAERAEEKASLGRDYDMNCYGSGFSNGEGSAAGDLAAEIRALPTPMESAIGEGEGARLMSGRKEVGNAVDC